MSHSDTPSSSAERSTCSRPTESSILGRYRLVSEQGAGALGSVWLAEDLSAERRVAVRFLPRELTDIANVADAVHGRARSFLDASRAHPGLTHVLEYATLDDGRLVAVMEGVAGRRLSEVIVARSTLDGPSILRLAVDLGEPVETLHNMGLVHGALHPGNFVLADGRTVLLDVETIPFRTMPSLQRLLVAHAPAPYLAPELREGGPHTEKTDVYAFAATIYELLTGFPPAVAAARVAAPDKDVTATRLSLWGRRWHISRGMEAVIRGALDARPDRRPFMSTILNHLAGSSPVQTRWPRRGVAAAAGLAVLTVIGAPMWSAYGPRRPLSPIPDPVAKEATTETAARPTTSSLPTDDVAGSAADPKPTPIAPAPPGTAVPSPVHVVVAPPATVRSTTGGSPPFPVEMSPPSPPAQVAQPPVRQPRSTAPRPAAPATAATPLPDATSTVGQPAAGMEGPPGPRTPLATNPPSAVPASPSSDDPDPKAVIDWLLQRR
jgi:serine/threonine protein kinase